MGFAVFSLGAVLTISGLVLAALGYANDPRAAWIIALVAVGQLLSLGSVSFIEDTRLQRLPAAGSSTAGSEARSRLGLSLLILHVALYCLVWALGVLSYTRASSEVPFPSVFGLSFEQQGPAFVWGVVCAELLFFLAVYTLGPRWWQRFKRLFRYQPPSAAATPETPQPPPSFRYRLGLGIFAVGNLLALSGLVLPALGLAEGRMVGVIAVLLGGGEVLSLSSIFFLGKEGFKQLKSRLFGALKRTPSGEPISQRRHRLGCTMLALHVLAQFAALVFPIASHYGVAADGVFPEVLGLGRADQLRWFLGLLIAAEALFFVGVYTLGEDWWGAFRALFSPPGAGDATPA